MTTKSPEELASDYAKITASDIAGEERVIGENPWMKRAFLAGYKAAMDRQENYERELGIIKARLDTAAQLYSLANEEKEQ